MVLDALGQKAGPEDTRTAAQRRHDAIEEACRRLIGGQLIPGPGRPAPHLPVHSTCTTCRRQHGGRYSNGPGPGDGGGRARSVYLTGPAAEAAACDAVVTPMVTGQIDWPVLDQLTTVWLTAHGHGHTGSPPDDHPDGPPESHGRTGPAGTTHGRRTTAAGRPPGRAAEDQRTAAGRPPDGPRDSQTDGPRKASGGRESHDAHQLAARTPATGPFHGHVPFPGTGHSPGPGQAPAAADDHDCAIAGCLEATRQRLQATILRWSLDLLSGPGGLASHLRGTVLGAPFNTPSQPLDLGRTTRTIPAAPAHRRHPARPALPVPRLHPAHRPSARCTT